MKRTYYLQHREEILKKTAQRHEKDLASLTYRKLVLVRKQLYNHKESIRALRIKIGRLQTKIKEKTNKKEALELAWLAERRQRGKNDPS